MTTAPSQKIAVLKALRKLLENRDTRRAWPPMKLAQEMWALTPTLRQQYGGEWQRFWSKQDRTIEHVVNGDYDKLKDHQLHDGFRAFLEKNYPGTLSRVDSGRAMQLGQFVEPLTQFFGGALHERTRDDHEAVLSAFQVMEFRLDEKSDEFSDHLRLGLRAPKDGSQWLQAVWFSSIDATHRYEGFVLRKLGLVLLRDVGDHRGLLVLQVHLWRSHTSSGYPCNVLQDFLPWKSTRGKLVACNDKETEAVATAFLNSLDNMKMAIYE